jgi:hypothetical protein
MKKLAVLAALVATMGLAHADAQVYGALNVSIVKQTGTGLDATNMNSTVLSPSVLGFRARESLGGGYGAGMNLETAVNLVSGNLGSGQSAVGGSVAQNNYATTGGIASVFYRQANVQLDTPYGEVKLGRQPTPTFIATGSVDALGIASGGISVVASNLSNPGMAGNGALSGVKTPFNPNLNVSTPNGSPWAYTNAIGFRSKEYSGFTVNALAGFAQPASTASNSDDQQATQNIVIGYRNGPVTALYGFQNINDNTGAKMSQSNIASIGYAVNKQLTVKASYFDTTFGKCNSTAAGGNCMNGTLGISAAGVITAATNAPVGTAYGADFKANAIGASYQASPQSRVALQYTEVKDSVTPTNKIGMTSLYADYDFSKSVKAFTFLSVADNSGNANMGPVFGQPAATPAKGQSISSLALGMKYVF